MFVVEVAGEVCITLEVPLELPGHCFISKGPSCLLNIILSILDVRTYRSKCLANCMCLGPGLFPYLDRTLRGYMIVTNVCTIPYMS